jgi:hypothetical protein
MNKVISKPTHKKKAHSMRISHNDIYSTSNGILADQML